MNERTLVLLKPDAVRRGLSGEIITRFEHKGLHIAAMKMLRFDTARTERHYAEHIGKEFFPRLAAFIQSGPCIALVLEGDEAIQIVRTMMGATKFSEAIPGTIRGDLAYSFTENLVHGSDSPESAAREIPIFFEEKEIFPPPGD